MIIIPFAAGSLRYDDSTLLLLRTCIYCGIVYVTAHTYILYYTGVRCSLKSVQKFKHFEDQQKVQRSILLTGFAVKS